MRLVLILALFLSVVFGRPDAPAPVGSTLLPQEIVAPLADADGSFGIIAEEVFHLVSVRVDSTQRLPGETGLAASTRLGIKDDVLWLARTLLSESNDASEYPMVADAIRNRVETCYLGDCTYERVVLRRQQFSAYNSRTKRKWLESLDYSDTYKSGKLWEGGRKLWIEALKAALAARTAKPWHRHVPIEARHYYSTVSMKSSYTTLCRNADGSIHASARLGRRHPTWAHDGPLVAVGPDPDRFRFMALPY